MSEFDEETPPHVICEKFLLESPPGQFGAVLSDLKLLHPALGELLLEGLVYRAVERGVCPERRVATRWEIVPAVTSGHYFRRPVLCPSAICQRW